MKQIEFEEYGNRIKRPKSGTGRRKKRRRKRRIFCFTALILLLILMVSIIFSKQILSGVENKTSSIMPEDGKISMEALNSSNAILVKLQAGADDNVLAEKNADEKIYPASLTKIMTAILAIENIDDMNMELEIPSNIFQYLNEMDASVAGFGAGETVTARDLIYGVLLESGAECCLTLAEFIAGSEDSYVELMNKKAQALGMEHTKFSNSTGLQDDRHYTTVRDLSVLLKYALGNEGFRKAFTSSTYVVGPTNMHPDGFTMQSTLFEKLESPQVNGGEIMGGKTGYTEEAGLCLASLASIDGQEFIVITANARGSHETEAFHIEDAVYIYNQIGIAR